MLIKEKGTLENNLIMPNDNRLVHSEDIAIIGIACRFPEADSYEQFWANLKEGKNSIKEMTSDHWDVGSFFSTDITEPNKSVSKWCGSLEGIYDFDNEFFNISPREAYSMDPQQRLLLEEAYHCIEDSGIPLQELQQKVTSIHVGVSTSDYYHQAFSADVEIDNYASLGNYKCVLANRVSYFLGFSGASMSIDTACASSLVALHEAKQELLNGNADFALAAAVNLCIHPGRYISFSKSRMLSPDGQCKTFDMDANGFVPGEGVGVLLLQRLNEALLQGNQVYGVLKGSAVNHGGKTQSITAPSVEAQKKVILAAYDDAGFSPATVNYVEAHGTGTSLGDPIEVEALTQAFNQFTDEKQFCKLGSVKTNIGHLEAAAGMAGVIKVLMMMKHRQIPQSLHIKRVNPIIEFEDSPFMVSTELADWQPLKKDTPLRAGISSFGFAGVNVHVVVEEFRLTVKDNKEDHKASQFFLLSAKTKDSLIGLVQKWQSFVHTEAFQHTSVPEICMNLQSSRELWKYRFGDKVTTKGEIISLLNRFTPEKITENDSGLPGIGIGDLSWSGFTIDKEDSFVYEYFESEIISLLAELTVIEGSQLGAMKKSFFRQKWAKSRKEVYSFILTYALISTLKKCGFAPKFVTGLKSGLWTALALTGMVSIKEMMTMLNGNTVKEELHITRPAIQLYDYIQQQWIKPIHLTEKEIKELFQLVFSLDELEYYVRKAKQLLENQYTFINLMKEWDVAFQAELGYSLIFLVQNEEAKNIIKDKLKAQLCLLAIAHSLQKLNKKWSLKDRNKLKDSSIYELIQLLIDQVVKPRELLSYLINKDYKTMALVINANQGKISSQYERINHQTRLFAGQGATGTWLDTLLNGTESDCFIDQHIVLLEEDDHLVLKPKEYIPVQQGISSILQHICLSGFSLNWPAINGSSYQKIALPTTCFNRSVYKLLNHESIKKQVGRHYEETNHDPTTHLHYFKKVWTSDEGQHASRRDEAWKGTVIFLTNKKTTSIAEQIFAAQGGVRKLIIQNKRSCEDVSLTYNPMDFSDSEDAFRVFNMLSFHPVIGLIDLSDLNNETEHDEVYQFGKIKFLQLLLSHFKDKAFKLLHVTKCLHHFGCAQSTISGALTAGFIRNLGAEYQHIIARTIDIDSYHSIEEVEGIIKEEWTQEHPYGEVCYRSNTKYLPKMSRLQKNDVDRVVQIDTNKVYMVTGGTGGLGAEVARYLVQHGAQKLILTGRQSLPEEREWKTLTKDHDHYDKIQLIRELESKGTQVFYFNGSLINQEDVKQYLTYIKQKHGKLGGVVHCAGLTINENPAFIRKRIQDMQQVLEPKVRALKVLHDETIHEGLDFFLLYSSVSAIVPRLAVGMSDYAAANAYMDYFASYQHTLGNTYYKSINWPAWKEVGMKWKMTGAYEETGILAHTRAEGMRMFDELLHSSYEPVIMPCTIEESLFHVEQLLSTTKNMKVPETREVNECIGLEMQSNGLVLIQNELKNLLAVELKISSDKLRAEVTFEDLGIDSILITELVRRIEKWLGSSLDPTVILEHPSINQLSTYLYEHYRSSIHSMHVKENRTIHENDIAGPTPVDKVGNIDFALTEKQSIPASVPRNQLHPAQHEQIAVIGMACQFPGARNLSQFWKNLITGTDSVSVVPHSRFNIEHLYSPVYEKGKSISKWGGFIEGIEDFDPDYFGIKQEDAAGFDPLIRKFLEVSAETFNHAGYRKSDVSGQRIGVFVGARVGEFSSRIREYKPNSIVGIGQNFIAAYLSHIFNLKGPNLVIDTACSSSLVSVHLACQSLKAGECEAAIAGGVDLLLDETLYLMMSEGKALSRDGKCHTFDEKANGFVLGEGCGAVMLKPLQKALEDGDTVYAVIEGNAVNNDGHTMGVTTPNFEAQQDVIQLALEKSGVNPATISYIESHGTGTMIGDPIELKALTNVFNNYTEEKGFCAIGSVKTNIGHLLSAAGIASFIKVVLSLFNQELPPSLHCNQPNPRFEFAKSPFYPNATWQKWTPLKGVRRAGISSFGFGGTNAHLIVREHQSEGGGVYQTRKPLPEIMFDRQKYWIPKRPSIEDSLVARTDTLKSDVNSISGLLHLVKEY